MIYDNILGAVGNTPIVRLNHVCSGLEAEVYAKLADHALVEAIRRPRVRSAERSSTGKT